ncbi:hypothetical protein [Streptomyces sp. NPDC046985]|uniref:Rv1733c family protein n=1 Tax=Streptomyces sp. NPDC046985 TaxID=3155377 RepID=UPI003407DDBB
MRVITGLWRWRASPLRRTTDLVEAWAALAALLLILSAVPLLGAVVGSAAQGALQQSVRHQRQTRHQVTATVVRKPHQVAPAADPQAPGRAARVQVIADWTAPDGSRRRGLVTTLLKTPRPGDRFVVWTDRRGRLVTRPLDATAATTHAVLAGLAASLLAAGLIEGIRRLILWRLVRLRYARWDRAWERAGPDWGRTGAGS